MTKEEAEALIGCEFPEGWSFQEIRRNGELAGFFCTKENEIHCHRLESYSGRWLTRQDIERLIRPLFLRHGVLKTKVRRHNDVGHAFVQRLGFEPVGADALCVYYEARKINHARL